jgi:RNA polymerase sigma factor (sigma-70 family)
MLQRIATRRAIDRLRRRYRDENALTDLHLCSYHRSAGELPDARVLAEELREQVRRALTKLPLQQAEAFWLRHIERRNSDEIAELMGVETGHARVLVHRAAIRLRTLLGPIYGSELVPDEMS